MCFSGRLPPNVFSAHTRSRTSKEVESSEEREQAKKVIRLSIVKGKYEFE